MLKYFMFIFVFLNYHLIIIFMIFIIDTIHQILFSISIILSKMFDIQQFPRFGISLVISRYNCHDGIILNLSLISYIYSSLYQPSLLVFNDYLNSLMLTTFMNLEDFYEDYSFLCIYIYLYYNLLKCIIDFYVFNILFTYIYLFK